MRPSQQLEISFSCPKNTKVGRISQDFRKIDENRLNHMTFHLLNKSALKTFFQKNINIHFVVLR